MIIGENNLRLVQFAISLKPFWRKKTVFWCMNKNVSIMPKLQPGGSQYTLITTVTNIFITNTETTQAIY